MEARTPCAPPNVDRVLEDLRTLDGLGPSDIARVLPELEHARARLWLRMLTSNQPPHTGPSEPARKLLTVQEVADQLRFSAGHVYELVRSGHLRGIRDGRTIRIAGEALAAWRTAHEAAQLDGSLPHSGESRVHEEPRAHADRPPLRPARAPGRPGRRPMTRSR